VAAFPPSERLGLFCQILFYSYFAVGQALLPFVPDSQALSCQGASVAYRKLRIPLPSPCSWAFFFLFGTRHLDFPAFVKSVECFGSKTCARRPLKCDSRPLENSDCS